MEACMLMFSLLVRVTLQILMILSMNHYLPLEEPMVSIAVFTFFQVACIILLWIVHSFFLLAIATFLPKPKSGKKKSLLGSSKGSEEEESAFQVLLIYFIASHALSYKLSLLFCYQFVLLNASVHFILILFLFLSSWYIFY